MELHARTPHLSKSASHARASLQTVLPIVCFAFLIRLLFVFLNYKTLPVSNHFEHFGAEMGWTARSLAEGHGFSSPFFPESGPTALVCPLFPLLLASIFKVFGVYSNASAFAALSLNSVLSSATAAAIYLGMRGHFGLRTARSAAWVWALYPYGIYYSAVYLWDCALTALLFACCFFLALNWLPNARLPGWAAYGLLAGLAALSNPSLLSLIPVMIGYAVWQRARRGHSALQPAIVSCGVLLLMLAPWTIRNFRVMHQTVLMRDGFWAEFYAGNSGDTSHSNPGWAHPASNEAEMQQYQRLGEAGYMLHKRALALDRVRHYPGAFALVSLRRVVRFWTGYWSFSHGYLQDEALDLPNVPFCMTLGVLMIVGIWQLYRRSRAIAFPYVAVLLLFPLPYYVTHASMDYRQPIEPVIVSMIAYGSACLLRSRRRAPSTGLKLPEQNNIGSISAGNRAA